MFATWLLPRTSYMLSVAAVNTDNQMGPPATILHTTTLPEGIITQLQDVFIDHLWIPRVCCLYVSGNAMEPWNILGPLIILVKPTEYWSILLK